METLGTRIKEFDIPICNSFQAKVKDDQLCYELDLQKLKNNKSPGPDGIPVKFFKHMNEECPDIVSNILNDCWINEIMPDEMELAELVTLYKKVM